MSDEKDDTLQAASLDGLNERTDPDGMNEMELDTSGFEPGLELASGFQPHAEPPPDQVAVPDGMELDTSGFEPGLELDLPGQPKQPAAAPMPVQQPRPPGHSAPAGFGQLDANAPRPAPGPAPLPGGPAPLPAGPAPAPPPPRGGPPPPQGRRSTSGGAGMNPRVLQIILMAGALLFAGVLAAVVMGGDSEPDEVVMEGGGPAKALEDGERAFHQGKYIEAIEAFQRLRRYPTSEEAIAARKQGLQARAIKEIMEAEPSSSAIRRLERLSVLFPERREIKVRLGEMRKSLSSGTRAAAMNPDAGSDVSTK